MNKQLESKETQTKPELYTLLGTGFYDRKNTEIKVNDLVVITDNLGLDQVIYKVIEYLDGFYTEPYDLDKMPIGTERATSGLFDKYTYDIIGSACA